MPTPIAGVRALACALCFALPAVAAEPDTNAVTRYPAAFFAQYQPGNAREMLERTPGLQLDYGSGVRGFEGAAGNILIDGARPATKSDFLGDILSRIPASKVERIEVVRGGAPGIDMQGKSVIANVILKKGRTVQGRVTSNAYLLQDGRELGGLEANASGGRGERTWEVSGFHQRGYADLIGPGLAVTIPPGRPARAARIRLEDDGFLDQITAAWSQPLAGGKLRLNGLAYWDDLKLEEDDTDVVSGAVESTDQRAKDYSREIGVAWSRPLPAQTTLDLVGLYRAYGLDLSSTQTSGGGHQRFDLDRDNTEAIARAALKWAWSRTLSVEAGAETARNRLENLTGFSVDGAAIPLPAADIEVAETRNQAFGKASWRPSAQWTLEGQLRYERSTVRARGDVRLEKTLQYAKPRLAITWAPDAQSQVRLRFERVVGQLSFDDFVAQANLNTATGVTAGNPDLEPERLWVAEAVFERRFWSRGALTLTASRAGIQGVVDRGPVFVPGGGVFDRPTNIGDGHRNVLRADLTTPLDRLGLKGGLLKGFVVYQRSQVDDPTTGRSRRISGERRVQWNTTLSQDLPKRSLTYGVYVEGGFQQRFYRFNAVDAVKLEPFVEVFAEWRPRKDLNLRVEFENLTRRGYRRTTLTYPGPRNAGGAPTLSDRDSHFGRVVYLRLRKSFGG